MKKYSFLDVLRKEIVLDENNNNSIILDKIEIPMIQRDYAQGRNDELVVRDRFLDSIFNSLTNNTILDLDFIYGSITTYEGSNNKTFSLLDGQQRLTTLFLLYWYIGSIELDNNEFKQLSISMGKFTYATRTSSSDFCKKLVHTRLEKNLDPKKYITNLPWFFKVYEKDPTIKAMLNMLISIHEQYSLVNETKKIFTNLQNLQFYILPLNGFNLSEELYIKMNSRGKQLTDFENFKADLINWMKDEENNKYYNSYQKITEQSQRALPRYLSISQKIDDSWTNFFWSYAKSSKEIEIDLLFIQLFYRYFLNQYIIFSKQEETKIDKEEVFTTLMQENTGTKYQEFLTFQKVLEQTDAIKTFQVFFDSFIENWEVIEDAINPSWQETSWSFLEKNISQTDRVSFMAISLYLEGNHDFNETSFRQWMRVVWNVLENTDIDSAATMISAMKLIEELSPCSSDIYSFLANKNNNIVSKSSKLALKEERDKAELIMKDTLWEEAFIKAEKHPFFKGSISFIMTDSMDIKLFNHSVEMAFNIFDKNGVKKKYREEGHLFLRALISQYQDASVIGQNFVDIDEKEHYLKKMLSGNHVVRNWTKQLFTLNNEQDILNNLRESVVADSLIEDENVDLNKLKRAHEALYKNPNLQNWLQKHEMIYFGWRWGHLFIWKKRSWYDWLMLESNRNIVISYILSRGFETEHQIEYENTKEAYYWGCNDIDMEGKINLNEIKFTFELNNSLKVYFKKNRF